MGLRFPDFLRKAGERGYPTTWKTWVDWEREGLITFRKTPGGTRIFNGIGEINKILDGFEKSTNKSK